MSNALGMSVRRGFVVFSLLVLPLSNQAAAQARPQPAVELAVGSVMFVDDGIVNETLIGGAARFYLLPRVSVGPEISYIKGDNHSQLILTGNVTLDLRRAVSGQLRRVTPYIVVGGGVFQSRDQSPRGTSTSSEGTFTAGGGVRFLAGERVTVGVDARIGWEPHLRLSGTVGVQLGR